MSKYRNYTDQDIINAVAASSSLAGVLKSLNLKPVGGNYSNMKRNLQRLNLDTSHFTGQGWSVGQQKKDWSEYTRASSLKPHLIAERGNKCELCELDEWMGYKIKLEIHHLNGDRTNNNPTNLQLLCPNCHSFTDTWRSNKPRNV